MGASTAVVQQIAGITTLLTLAAVALAVARRLHVPFAVTMIASGVALAAFAQVLPGGTAAYLVPSIPPGIILFLFLPALIFEPALHIDLRQLRENFVPVLALAVPGVVATTGIIGLAVWWLTPLDLGWSLTLGAMLSAVDPVAVMALYGRLGMHPRILGILEGETLIGSGVAIVTSRVLVAIALTGALTSGDVWQGAGAIAVASIGGAIVGWLIALAWGWVLSKSEGDPFVETALTTVLAYASYLIAELMFDASGVAATLAAGITLGTWGRTKIYVAVESYLDKFWDFAAAATAAIVLLLMGLTVDLGAVSEYWDLILVAIIAMVLARAAMVFVLMPAVGIFAASAKLAGAEGTAIWWGGMRGTAAAALALSLGAGPYQTAILVTVTTAVLFSVLVQGLTLERLIRALSLERRPMADRIGRDEGLRTAMRRGSRETPELKRGGRFSSRPGASKGAGPEDDLRRLQDEIEGAARSTTEADQERSLLLMRCFQVEREFFDDVFAKAHLSERAYRDLRYSVTLQSRAVRYNDPLPKATLHSGATFDFFDFQRRARILNDYETAWGRFQASSYILGLLDDLAAQVLTPDAITASVREIYEGWQLRAQKRVDSVAEHFPDYVNRMQERMADRLAAQAESEVGGKSRARRLDPIPGRRRPKPCTGQNHSFFAWRHAANPASRPGGDFGKIRVFQEPAEGRAGAGGKPFAPPNNPRLPVRRQLWAPQQFDVCHRSWHC